MLPSLTKLGQLSRQSIIIKTLRRLLPTLIGLFIIGTFLQTNPKLAVQFTNQLLEKLGLSSQLPLTQTDYFKEINDYRQDNSKSSLSHTTTLDSLAHILALSTANTNDLTPQITLDQAAGIVGFNFSSLESLIFISPTFSVTNSWLTENQDTLLNPKFTQIGLSSLTITQDQQEQLLTVVVLANPSSSQSSNLPKKTTQNYYTGVELWNEIQKYRTEHGVPEFRQDITLCTIASIRLNQLIELGKLDNHDGFAPLVDQFRNDGRLIHTNIAENILTGYSTPASAVTAWDGSPGHQSLLKDGAYVFACTAANHGFAVLVAAF